MNRCDFCFENFKQSTPYLLPCGYSICATHIINDRFNCIYCDVEHSDLKVNKKAKVMMDYNVEKIDIELEEAVESFDTKYRTMLEEDYGCGKWGVINKIRMKNKLDSNSEKDSEIEKRLCDMDLPLYGRIDSIRNECKKRGVMNLVSKLKLIDSIKNINKHIDHQMYKISCIKKLNSEVQNEKSIEHCIKELTTSFVSFIYFYFYTL